jgi:hypothetical protein
MSLFWNCFSLATFGLSPWGVPDPKLTLNNLLQEVYSSATLLQVEDAFTHRLHQES